jgi:hypothetical protein
MNGDLDTIRSLIARGEDVNRRDGAGGTTALIYAAMRCRTECLQALLEAGADVNAKGEKGQTAMQVAELMIQTYEAGLKPFHDATVSGYTAIVKLLKAAETRGESKAKAAAPEVIRSGPPPHKLDSDAISAQLSGLPTRALLAIAARALRRLELVGGDTAACKQIARLHKDVSELEYEAGLAKDRPDPYWRPDHTFRRSSDPFIQLDEVSASLAAYIGLRRRDIDGLAVTGGHAAVIGAPEHETIDALDRADLLIPTRDATRLTVTKWLTSSTHFIETVVANDAVKQKWTEQFYRDSERLQKLAVERSLADSSGIDREWLGPEERMDG